MSSIANGVTFDEIHSFRDFGLILTDVKISSPEPQTKMVSVPVRNGDIDMSDVVSGNTRFKNRTIVFTFISNKKVEDWLLEISNIRNKIAGQKKRIIIDYDPAFYWYGRITDVSQEISDSAESIVVTASVDPYKYAINTSEEDWLWDPFDFEQSVINETADLVVDGSLEVSIIAGKKWDNPIVISDSDMTVAFKGSTYQIKAGSQVMYDIILEEGENILTFTGNGKVTINYVGGML